MLTFFLKASRRPEEAYAWCGEACVRPQFLWLPHVVRVGFLEEERQHHDLKDSRIPRRVVGVLLETEGDCSLRKGWSSRASSVLGRG